MNNDTGVYAIISPSGKQYIGSAASIKRRWLQHKWDLRKGNHHSRALQRAWNKYGEAAFEFRKIALCPITDLLAVEQSRIDSLNPEYNICRVAGTSLGIKWPEDARRRFSERRTGMILADDHRMAISKSLSGRKQSAEHIRKNAVRQIGEGNHMWGRKGADHHRSKPVMCESNGMVFESVKAAADWVRTQGFPKAGSQHICGTCTGARKWAYGHVWRYAK